MSEHHAVVIIGAGATGLYAAQKLKAAGITDVVIVEASKVAGGRIRQLEGLAPWPIQLGPEFIHGAENSLFKDEIDRLEWKLQKKEWPDWWYFKKEKKLLNPEQGEADVDIQRVMDLFDEAENEKEPAPGRDVSATDWLKSKGATQRQLEIAEACFANDFGCSLRQLGLREMIKENNLWTYGESYLIPTDHSYSELIADLAAGVKIKYSWPVARIEYSSQQGVPVRLEGAQGEQMTADRVLITASINVLRSGLLQFTPLLPVEKRAAMSRLGMGNAVKVILGFREPFWPQEMYDIVSPGGFIPELWMISAAETDSNTASRCSMTCFLAGERADEASRMDPRALLRRCLEEVDEIFATPGDPSPASSRLTAHHIADWSKEKYIQGAYTYPTHGAEAGDRDALARPVAGRLFFAGEATHPGVNPCVQGAFETAARAATQIAASLVAPVSKL